MKLKQAIKSIQIGNGLIRVIDEKGVIIEENEIDNEINIEFISSIWYKNL